MSTEPDKQGPPHPAPAQILVLGMHRSGTSALTGALSGMGAYVGKPKELTVTSGENPTGFFERKDARRACDRILHRAGADWWKIAEFDPGRIQADPLSDTSRDLAALVGKLDRKGCAWALKEPRLCLLMPLILPLLTHPFALVIHRDPIEVARSLRTRNGFPLHAGLALWEAYNAAALTHAASIPHLVISHAELMARPADALETIACTLEETYGIKGLDPAEGALHIQPAHHRERLGPDQTYPLTPAQQEMKAFLAGSRTARGAPDRSHAAMAVLSDFERYQAERLHLAEAVEHARSVMAERAIQDDEAHGKTVQSHADLSGQTDKLWAALAQKSRQADTAAKALKRERRRCEKLRTSLEAARSQAVRASGALSQAQKVLKLQRWAEAHAGDRVRADLVARRRVASLKPVFRFWTRNRRMRTLSLSMTPLFDAEWYLQRNPDVADAGIDPIEHYIRRGAREGRDPHPLFRHAFIAPVLGSGDREELTPLERYLDEPDAWKHSPHPLFDTARYLRAFEGAPPPIAPIAHYIEAGAPAGRNPNRWFDTIHYIETNPDVARSGINPLEHYVRTGSAEGRSPCPDFSPSTYLKRYPEIARSGIEPLEHFILRGHAEGRSARPDR